MDVITNSRRSLKAQRKVDHCMYEYSLSMGFALVWLGPQLADQKPKPGATSRPTCSRPTPRAATKAQLPESTERS